MIAITIADKKPTTVGTYCLARKEKYEQSKWHEPYVSKETQANLLMENIFRVEQSQMKPRSPLRKKSRNQPKNHQLMEKYLSSREAEEVTV